VAPKLEEKSQNFNGCGVVATKKPPDGDGDPFAALKDESLKLNPGLDEYPDLPPCLHRRRTSRPQDE
jgi:hypothetical protein